VWEAAEIGTDGTVFREFTVWSETIAFEDGDGLSMDDVSKVRDFRGEMDFDNVIAWLAASILHLSATDDNLCPPNEHLASEIEGLPVTAASS